MRTVLAILAEVWGLFVDDGSLALALAAWCALAGLALPAAPLPAAWDAGVFFLGVVAILIENVRRSAIKTKSQGARRAD